MRLTGRQRDFLASYPNDIEVFVRQEGDDLVVQAGDDEGLHLDYQTLVLPPEGFIDQPHIECHDWEESLHQIPTRALNEDQLNVLRERQLDALPSAVSLVFFCLMGVMQSECPDNPVDWDDVLAVLVRRQETEADP